MPVRSSRGSVNGETQGAARTESNNTIPTNQEQGNRGSIPDNYKKEEGEKMEVSVRVVSLVMHSHELGGAELMKEH